MLRLAISTLIATGDGRPHHDGAHDGRPHHNGGIHLPRDHPNRPQPGAAPQVFTLTLLTDAVADGAVSLDGSPAAYYYSAGAETNKWYIVR